MKRETSASLERRHARELAVKILYEAEIGCLTCEEAIGLAKRKLRRAGARELAVQLINQTLENIGRVDKIVGEAAENWDLARMAALDRNILRLATAELVFSDVPTKVVINEAIEIAKRYSTDESGRFVNGILDRVARMRSEIRRNI